MTNNAKLINQDSGNFEYYTPIELVEAARLVMGDISLDPASSETANKRIQACYYFNKDGLNKTWFGSVWMNPAQYGIISPCQISNAQSVKNASQHQKSSSMLEEIERGAIHLCAKNAQGKMTSFVIKIDTNLRLLGQSFILELNKVIWSAPAAEREKLCRLITLRCALICEQGIPLRVKSAIEENLEKDRQLEEKILPKWIRLKLKEKDTSDQIKGLTTKENQAKYTTTKEGSGSSVSNMIGVLKNGTSAGHILDSYAPIAEKVEVLSRIIISRYQAIYTKEPCAPIWFRRALNAIEAKERYYLKTGAKSQREAGLRNILSQWVEIKFPATVWMNHPFSRTNNPLWINKLVESYEDGDIEQACCITFAATSEAWFRPLLGYLQCFIHGRTNYYLPNGEKKTGVTKGSVITYLGNDEDVFKDVFSQFGTVK